MSQEDIVCYHNDDQDRMFEAQQSVLEARSAQYRMFSDNPLEMGYFLDSIDKGELVIIDYVERNSNKVTHGLLYSSRWI